jgi:hypothetical protein
MAKTYVTEYAGQVADRRGISIPTGEEPSLGTLVLDHGAGVANSANLNAKTRLIRVHADAIASVKIGAAAVATTADMRFAAGQTEYFGITPEAIVAGVRVSAITNT